MNATNLELHECEVTAARAHETRRGLAFSGLLWVRGVPVAEFENDGNGGCNIYHPRRGPEGWWPTYKAMCKRIAPVEFEHTDYVTGVLWDWTMLRDPEAFARLHPAKGMPDTLLGELAKFTAVQRKKLDWKPKRGA